ncbi:hypothetical protein ABXS75_14275 [Roseburia hominis]
MSEILVWKEKVQNLYANYSIYFDKGFQFILGFVSFFLINQNLGLMKVVATPIVTMALAIICTFLPPVFTVVAAAGLILAHMFKLSLGVMAVSALIFVMMFIFYCRFTPKRAILLLITPIAFMLKIPYVVPVACGLAMTPVTAVPIAFGAIVYYMIMCVKSSSAVIKGAEGIVGQISIFVKMVLQDKSLWITIIAFVICVFTVYTIRRLSVDHAWKIAASAGAVANIIVVVAGDMAFNIHTSYGALIAGNLFAILVGLILEFFLFSVDYSRTEHLQYEDDDYYYYVKAVPKISISAPEKQIKRINERRDEMEELEEDYTSRGREASAKQRVPKKRPGGSRKTDTSSGPRKVSVASNTDELLLAKSLKDELDIENIVRKELEE